MSDLTFHLHALGSMLKGAKLYVLGKGVTYYDSLQGFFPAEFVSVADKEPEILEDTSLAPWVKLNIRVEWPGLGWKDEAVKAESLIPQNAVDQREYTTYIRPFRWRAP